MMAVSEDLAEQARLIEEASGFASEQRHNLRNAIQENDLESAIRVGLTLANELRATRLLPGNYYKLYMLVFWELQQLAAFLACTEQHGFDLESVYQIVQHEGNILPRLYLLVTVGVVRVQQGVPDAQDILADLASLLTAVKHPIRGLFVRYYLLQMTKDKITRCLGIRGALNFLLSNFGESASLWVRLRHESAPTLAASPSDKVENSVWNLDRFRCSLRLLVGAHLMHLARLCLSSGDAVENNGVPKAGGHDHCLYEEVVLPAVLLRSTACEDPPGKAYLLDCFVDVFPDHYHLATLESVLAACAEVHWHIDLKSLLQRLMRRLTSHLKEHPSSAVEFSATTFSLLHRHLQLLIRRPKCEAIPLASILELQLELLLSTLALHPENVERVDLVLKETVVLLESYGSGLDARSIECIVNLLAAPLTQENLVPAVLAMPHYSHFINAFDHASHREGSVAMVSALLAGDVGLRDSETLSRLFVIIDPLIHDESGGINGERYHEFDPVVFTAEQEKVAKLVHQVRHADPAEVFRMLKVVRRHFQEGGPHRVKYTLPAIVVATLRIVTPLVQQLSKSASTPAVYLEELFGFVQETCIILSALQPEESLNLWLLCASMVNRADHTLGSPGQLSSHCAAFIDHALVSLESEIKVQRSQCRALFLIVGTLREISCLKEDAYLTAASRAVKCGTQFKTKKAQSKALCLCSNLFWSASCRESSQVLSCIRRSLRLADGAIHSDPLDVMLFIEILDQAVWLFEAGNEAITPSFLASLLALCSQHLKYINGRAPAEARRALASTAARLQGNGSGAGTVKLQADAQLQSVLCNLEVKAVT